MRDFSRKPSTVGMLELGSLSSSRPVCEEWASEIIDSEGARAESRSSIVWTAVAFWGAPRN